MKYLSYAIKYSTNPKSKLMINVNKDSKRHYNIVVLFSLEGISSQINLVCVLVKIIH